MVGMMKYPKECALCETPVHNVVDGRLRRNGEYHEVVLTLSDLSKMKVAVCSIHTEPTKDQLPMVAQKVKQGWMEEVAFGIGNKDWLENTGLKLEIVGVER